MLNRRFTIPAIMTSILIVSGCRMLEPVSNISNVSYATSAYSSSTTLTLDDYERAIVRAGANRDWRFNQVAPGHLEGNLNVRGKHDASVDILFNTETYSINYKGSQGLKYDPAKNEIHPNYNSWIKLLDGDIRKEITKIQAS